MIVVAEQDRPSIYAAIATVEVDGMYAGNIYPAVDYDLFKLGYVDLVVTMNLDSNAETHPWQFIRVSCKPKEVELNLKALYRNDLRYVTLAAKEIADTFPEHWSEYDAITSDNH